MASVHSTRESGRWKIRWRDPDGTERTRIFRGSKRDAEAAARAVEHRLSRARFGLAQTGEVVTFLQAANSHIDSLLAAGRRPNTVHRQRDAAVLFARFVEESRPRGFGGVGHDYPAGQIDRAVLESFRAWLFRGGRRGPRKPRSVRNVDASIRRVLAHYSEKDRDFRPPSLPPISLDESIVSPFTWEEMDALLARLPRSPWEILFVVRYTGCRHGEVAGLEARDVNLARGTVQIRPENDKRRRGREIPLHAELRAFLASAIVHRPEGLLFPNANGGPRNAFQKKDLLPTFRDCGLEYRSTHIWRHSFQTMLHRQSVPYAKVERFVGHKLAGAGDIYTHLGGEDLRDVVAAIPGPDCEGAGAERGEN